MAKHCIYKSFVLSRIVEFCNNCESDGPVFNILQTAKKYGLLDIIVQSAYSGIYMNRLRWKRIVKQVIKMHEYKRHYISTYMYTKLVLYRSSMTHSAISPWWVHASRYPNERNSVVLLFRIIVGVHVFEKDGNYNGRSKCILCDNNADNSLQHVLYECESLCDLRKREMDEIINFCPHPFTQYYNSLSIYEKTCFIVKSFGCEVYINEFHKIFTYFGRFVTNMVKQKHQLSEANIIPNT